MNYDQPFLFTRPLQFEKGKMGLNQYMAVFIDEQICGMRDMNKLMLKIFNNLNPTFLFFMK